MAYTREFWNTYEDERKIFFVNFLDMHEGTHEVINYLDGPLSKFIREFENDDTTIVMFSDHGPHMGGLLKAVGGI